MNTIHPSTQRVHSAMSNVKDAIATVTAERSAKRSLNVNARHDSRQRSIEQHAHADHAGHVRDGNDSTALNASLNQSRQSWTHTAFSRFIPVTESNDRGLLQLQPHTSASSGLSLAGVCTVHIGPHIFLDTKFFTVHNLPHTAVVNRRLSFDSSGSKEIQAQYHNQQQQPVMTSVQASAANPSSQIMKPQHQVAMEFKENPGAIWLFPEEASLEFTPANDRDSAQIAASFYLPIPERSNSGGYKSESTHQAITMVIQHATTALREGLELAVKGPQVTNWLSAHKLNVTGRQHNISTYSENPSEILGSGKQAPHNNSSNSSNTSPSKRKADVVSENQKPPKPKRPREQDDKASTGKKAAATSGSKKNGASGLPSNSAQQKHCGYCDCTTTPMWRRGPNGPSTLCNACGVKWKHGKILQDPKDTHQSPKSGSSVSISSPPGLASSSGAHRSSGSKTMKQASENGHSRQTDDKKINKINNKKSTHGPPQGEYAEKFDTRENNGSRVHEGERMIPVKKRHSGKATPVSPPGPRMVPIHELGDPTKTPSKFPLMSRKHIHDDVESAVMNGRIKQYKNGFGRHDPPVDTMSSSASTTSSQSESNEPRLGTNRSASTSAVRHTTDDNLSLYTRNRYTNNTATFPLHFPTISIAFGPNNAYYTYPNCAMVLYENHFQIKLIQDGERTEIDVWKEGIEGTEFKAVDVGDGESMIIMKALLRQYLTRFDKELLNPDRNESLIVFRFRERLDGGGPSVKPLLEHWLATDIPVPPPPSNNSA